MEKPCRRKLRLNVLTAATADASIFSARKETIRIRSREMAQSRGVGFISPRITHSLKHSDLACTLSDPLSSLYPQHFLESPHKHASMFQGSLLGDPSQDR